MAHTRRRGGGRKSGSLCPKSVRMRFFGGGAPVPSVKGAGIPVTCVPKVQGFFWEGACSFQKGGQISKQGWGDDDDDDCVRSGLQETRGRPVQDRQEMQQMQEIQDRQEAWEE